MAGVVLKLDGQYMFNEMLQIWRKDNNLLVYQFNTDVSEKLSENNNTQKINIFSHLQSREKKEIISNQEHIYKIKLNFIKSYYENNIQDIEMCLYECKLLKNGKYSA